MAANRSIPNYAAGATVVIIAAAVAAPIAAALWGAAGAERSLAQLFQGPGLRYAMGTVALCAMAGLGAAVLGAGAAAAVCLTQFPGRRLFALALALPFAIPAYVSAYAYGDFLSPLGAVAGFIGVGNLPQIRSTPGAAFVLMLSTYPYVYLAMAASLSARSSALMEAARTLGAGPTGAAFSVLVAAGRPALAGGLALALMEIAAEYGVADYFGVPTLSVGIFRTWHGLGDLGAATQLAALLFFTALIFVLLEESGRRGRAAEAAYSRQEGQRIALSPVHALFVLGAISLPVLFGFILPAGVLAAKLVQSDSPAAARGLIDAFSNTGLVALAGAAVAVSTAGLLAYADRSARTSFTRTMLRVATLGYAVPGAVIAIGLLALAATLSQWFGAGAAGGIVILIYAYGARFLTAAYNVIAGGLAQINPQMDAAAKTLGAGPGKIVRVVHWPQLRGAIAAGGAIVAIDIAKELPATLLLRPFNFETLATHVYRLASDERLADAAPAALLLITLGLIPVLMIGGAVFAGANRRDKRRGDRRGKDRDSGAATPTADYQDPAAPR